MCANSYQTSTALTNDSRNVAIPVPGTCKAPITASEDRFLYHAPISVCALLVISTIGAPGWLVRAKVCNGLRAADQ